MKYFKSLKIPLRFASFPFKCIDRTWDYSSIIYILRWSSAWQLSIRIITVSQSQRFVPWVSHHFGSCISQIHKPWLICTHPYRSMYCRKLLYHSISIIWQKYKNVLTPHQQFGNFVTFTLRFRINFRLYKIFYLFFVYLGGEFLHTRHFPKLTAEKMCNQNSRFIHWQSFKTKIFFCSPQRNKKFAIFLLFSFCFVLFGACRIRRDCVVFFFLLFL